jgi:hypothetical protein
MSCLILFSFFVSTCAIAQDGFKSLFNGKDLTGADNRYTLRDLLENIVNPGKVTSEQNESGIIGEEGGILQVATNQITEVRNPDLIAYILSGGDKRNKVFKK